MPGIIARYQMELSTRDVSPLEESVTTCNSLVTRSRRVEPGDQIRCRHRCHAKCSASGRSRAWWWKFAEWAESLGLLLNPDEAPKRRHRRPGLDA